MDQSGLALPGGEPVVLVPYSEDWPRRFAVWHERLGSALVPMALAIEHVGSTAVPGLAAKPVIDIQVSVRDVHDEAGYRSAIESLGLVLRVREPGHRFFRPDVVAGAHRTVHVHVCSRGSRWERDHIAFREALRADPNRRVAYAALKRGLADRFVGDRVAYTNAKAAFVAETLGLHPLLRFLLADSPSATAWLGAPTPTSDGAGENWRNPPSP